MLENASMIFNLAHSYFHNSTEQIHNTKQFKYLRHIGYEVDTIKTLDPGYGGDSSEDFINFLVDHNVDPEIITALELDEVAGKIIFTKFDRDGNITGFSCRAMDENVEPRYKKISALSLQDENQLKVA